MPTKTLRFLTRLRVGDSHRRRVVVNSGKAPTAWEIAMRPKQPEARSDDLFRSSLEAIVDPAHELVRLASLIDWGRFDDAFGTHYHDRKGWRGLPTRLMTGLHLLKHMKGLSDEETCAAWLENPYFQAFCGETHFQHRLPFDRSSMTRRRKRIGADDLEALLAETIAVAVKTKAVSQRQLERMTVDTTVQTKAVAHPIDSHLILRAIEWLNRLARRHQINLRQSFLRLATRARREVARLLHGRGHKQGLRWLRYMRTWLGRLIRDIRRKIAGDPALEATCHGAGACRTGPEPAARRQEQTLRIARPRGGMYRKGQGAHPLRVRLQDVHRHHQRALQRRPVRPRRRGSTGQSL
jgi:IS5 family transposase